MQLPPALHARLSAGPAATEPLPVQRDPAAGAAPFRFAARRVRFPREHEFFEDGDVQRHLYLQDVLTQVAGPPERPRVPEFTCQVAGCCQVFDVLEAYEHHYHALHRNVCSFCKRAFPSGHLLDTHILEWHDSLFQILAERQDMYQCLVEGCTEKFKTSKDRKDHLVRRHLYPADFRFDKPKKSSGCGHRSPSTSRSPGPPAALQELAGALGEGSLPLEGEDMEVCSEHTAPPAEPRGERRTHGHRIPSTICFGQGAARGFKSTKKRNKQQ
ncbi:zinc finger protein 511 isoform X1 [Rhinolophus sinicus]|uniref:zinc finger protein 511 isoform X1 n=1 Tax=Rhinolophus sinicus TaxID=89399 RepID=UPI003D78CA92